MDSSLDYNKLALAFLQSHTVAILSTVSQDNKPDAAVIYTLVDEQFNFFFITKSDTTKAKNLESNKNAALTIVEPEKLLTAQIKGTVNNLEGHPNYKTIFLQTAEIGNRIGEPPMSQLTNSGNFILYKLVPTWLRYGDFSKNSNVTELKSVFHQII